MDRFWGQWLTLVLLINSFLIYFVSKKILFIATQTEKCLPFFGRAYGVLKLHWGWLSSSSRLLLARFSLWTIWGRKIWSWSIDAVCAKRMRSLLSICFFIVSVHNSYGTLFSCVLAWRGLCLVGFWTFCNAGGRGVTLEASWFGRWSYFVSCGVCGLNGIEDFLRIPKGAWRIFYIFFSLPSSLGRQLSLPLLWFLTLIFFFFSIAPLRRSLVYFVCTRVAPLCAFSM